MLKRDAYQDRRRRSQTSLLASPPPFRGGFKFIASIYFPSPPREKTQEEEERKLGDEAGR